MKCVQPKAIGRVIISEWFFYIVNTVLRGFAMRYLSGLKKKEHFICDCEVLHLERDVFCIMHGMPSFSHRPLDMAAPDLNVKSCPHVSDFLSSKRPAL